MQRLFTRPSSFSIRALEVRFSHGISRIFTSAVTGTACLEKIGTACLENELLPKYIEALSRNKDIVLTGDLNCDLLSNNPRGEALLSFCATVNATQLIDKPTRGTENSRSLLDVILVSDPVLVKSSGVLEIIISDHFLVHVVINLRSPKQAPTYIVTRSFRNYKADQFANDIAHIPWETMNLIDESVDNSLDAFNDLLLACLDDHAPIKAVKMAVFILEMTLAGRRP